MFAISKSLTEEEGDMSTSVAAADDSGKETDGFALLPQWKKRKTKKAKMSTWNSNTEVPVSLAASVSPHPDLGESTIRDGSSCMNYFVIHPHDGKRGCWDCVSLMLVIYDMVMIPFQFFEPEPNFISIGMSWISRFFWSLDLPLSFFTGYVTVDGFINMTFKTIATRYLLSWFCLDCILITIDWLEILMMAHSSMGLARMGKATRTFRIIRMLRLLRLARMRQVVVLLTERFRSEKVVVVFDILRLVGCTLGFAHFLACFWYGLGLAQPQGMHDPGSWVYQADLSQASLEHRYAVSLHWSITQFAGGMDEFTPESMWERVYAICAFMLGFVVAAWFVSSLTSSMTQLNIIGGDLTQQLSSLRVYLNQHGITNKLALRVHRNAQHQLAEQQRAMPEANVELLSLVSEPLRVEIHLEMYAPHLASHPFFSTYIANVPQVMRKVCHLGTAFLQLSAGDVVFSAGEIPEHPKMYFVVAGTLVYSRAVEELVTERMWVAEPVLWTEWTHVGELVSKGDCRICTLDAGEFQRIALHFDHDSSLVNPIEYADCFIRTLNTFGRNDLTDLPIILEGYESEEISRNSSSESLGQRRRTARSFMLGSRKSGVTHGWRPRGSAQQGRTTGGFFGGGARRTFKAARTLSSMSNGSACSSINSSPQGR